MADILVRKFNERLLQRDDAASRFFGFEPWDVPERPAWVMEQAVRDGVGLYAPRFAKHVGTGAHLFQTGFLLSPAFFRIIMAGTQIGKSICVGVEQTIMLTGERPLALRLPRGQVSEVRRAITKDNVLRHGRICVRTGTVLDHEYGKDRAGAGSDWDCGYITGAGIYPEEKIAPAGSTVWLGSFIKAINEHWWPDFTDPRRMLIPANYIDETRGNKGYDRTNNQHVIHLKNGGRSSIISYEAKYHAFEAEKVWACFLDEEPPDQRIVAAAQTHVQCGLAIAETPYQGITYTEALAFPDAVSPHRATFHATAYDCPYNTRDRIEITRSEMPAWEIGARIWGVPSTNEGKPYFDRAALMRWNMQSLHTWQLVEFRPKTPFNSVGGAQPGGMSLMDIDVLPVHVNTETENIWRVFEDRQQNAAYLMVCDPAEGAEDPDEGQDYNAAVVFRVEPGEKKAQWHVVATLMNRIPTTGFAQQAAIAARYYYGACMAGLVRKAAAGGIFWAELQDYPFWYQHTTVNWATRREQRKPGFDESQKSREESWRLVKEHLESVLGEEHRLRDPRLLEELAAAVVGKNGRCDHVKRRGHHLDLGTAFAIGLWVVTYASDQVRCNMPESESAEPKRSRLARDADRRAAQDSAELCGMTHLGYGQGAGDA